MRQAALYNKMIDNRPGRALQFCRAIRNVKNVLDARVIIVTDGEYAFGMDGSWIYSEREGCVA